MSNRDPFKVTLLTGVCCKETLGRKCLSSWITFFQKMGRESEIRVTLYFTPRIRNFPVPSISYHTCFFNFWFFFLLVFLSRFLTIYSLSAYCLLCGASLLFLQHHLSLGSCSIYLTLTYSMANPTVQNIHIK